MGHTVKTGGSMGGYQGILIDWEKGVLHGATESRKDGAALGLLSTCHLPRRSWGRSQWSRLGSHCGRGPRAADLSTSVNRPLPNLALTARFDLPQAKLGRGDKKITLEKLLYMSTNSLYASTILLVCLLGSVSAQTTPLVRAHAHNDYLHTRPLLDALDQGFCSVEADIFWLDGKLLVAHTRLEVTKDRTLEALYLDPLKKRIAENGGQVFRDGPQFGLLIDLKTDGEKTYQALHEVLSRYAELFSRVENGQVKPGPVQVVISGNRPQELIAAQSVRYCGIDGRLSDLDSDKSAELLPMISDNWTSHFKWRGVGEMPAEERQKLRDIVQRSHAKGRVVRFWATPETSELWKELNAAGVDRINTDKLEELAAFLKRSDKKTE